MDATVQFIWLPARLNPGVAYSYARAGRMRPKQSNRERRDLGREGGGLSQELSEVSKRNGSSEAARRSPHRWFRRKFRSEVVSSEVPGRRLERLTCE
jgi:hypothetical protein